MERPGHGLDEYLAKLNAIPREVNITQHVTRIERTGDGVRLGKGGQSLRDLARAVSRELARLEDEEGGL